MVVEAEEREKEREEERVEEWVEKRVEERPASEEKLPLVFILPALVSASWKAAVLLIAHMRVAHVWRKHPPREAAIWETAIREATIGKFMFVFVFMHSLMHSTLHSVGSYEIVVYHL